MAQKISVKGGDQETEEAVLFQFQKITELR
jgi:hypothetical protein